ncbi:uncharacterized protein METZ01_LOCUS537, partial [marine metagenome]
VARNSFDAFHLELSSTPIRAPESVSIRGAKATVSEVTVPRGSKTI